MKTTINPHILRGLATVLLTAPLALAGCSGDEDSGESPGPERNAAAADSRPAPPPAEVDPIEASLTVTDPAGEEIALERKPERVVCLTGICDDLLIELGLEPVATTSPDLLADDRFLGAHKAGKVPVVQGGFGSEDVGDIASHKPDLVIGLAGVHEGLADGVGKFATMWNMEVDSVADSVGYLRAMAALTGRTAEGEKAEAEFYDTVREAREQADEANLRERTAASMYTSSTGTGVNTRDELLGELLANAYAYPWEGKGDDPMTAGQYSVEEILDKNPDIIFVQSFVFAPGDETLTEKWADNPVWKKVAAVENGEVHEVSTGLWSMGRGPRALGAVLEEAVAAGR